tara:strand:+ start:55 stop:351 length:297 start_codon:yes stop_codon:yes gene_type:complete
MKTIWFIDDEEDLLSLYRDIFEEEESLDSIDKKYITHHDECKAVSGDIVIHDLYGVGKVDRIDGVQYRSCSGSFVDKSDFLKPMDFEKMSLAIRKLHG